MDHRSQKLKKLTASQESLNQQQQLQEQRREQQQDEQRRWEQLQQQQQERRLEQLRLGSKATGVGQQGFEGSTEGVEPWPLLEGPVNADGIEVSVFRANDWRGVEWRVGGGTMAIARGPHECEQYGGCNDQQGVEWRRGVESVPLLLMCPMNADGTRVDVQSCGCAMLGVRPMYKERGGSGDKAEGMLGWFVYYYYAYAGIRDGQGAQKG
eukprot:scaffold80364_cov17-Tisochrysis_lutea.AAC.1